jgi:hypothetical protein
VLHRVARWFVFKPKIPILGKFWRVLQWNILVYFITISSILLLLEIFYGHLVYFVVIWYIFARFGILYQEKSGNPGAAGKTSRVNLVPRQFPDRLFPKTTFPRHDTNDVSLNDVW